MCVIVFADKNKSLSKKILENCYNHNRDGFGIMWAEKDQLHIVKSLGNFDEFIKMWRDVPRNTRRAIHFRFKTHGPINEDNCHPFICADNLAMMHNGVIETPMITEDMSDSFNFVEHQLKPWVSQFPKFLEHEIILKMLEKITTGSKLFFMNNKGRIEATCKDDWHKEEGCWFSNKYSTEAGYRYCAPYKNSSSLITNAAAVINKGIEGIQNLVVPRKDNIVPIRSSNLYAAVEEELGEEEYNLSEEDFMSWEDLNIAPQEAIADWCENSPQTAAATIMVMLGRTDTETAVDESIVAAM